VQRAKLSVRGCFTSRGRNNTGCALCEPMSSILVVDEVQHEVQKLESSFKEALTKVQVRFQQQLMMERQDRQDSVAKLRRSLEVQQEGLEKAVQLSAEEGQQNSADAGNSQFSLRVTAVEAAITELQQAINGHAEVVETVRQETTMLAVAQKDIVKQQDSTADLCMEVALYNASVQELRQDVRVERMQLMEQGSKFSSLAEEIGELKLKVSVRA